MLGKMASIANLPQAEPQAEPASESLAPLVATLAEREATAAAAIAAEDARELLVVLANLPPAELTRFRERVANRRGAGEPEPGLEWRALVDVRVEFGHWRL